jgi:hypothetical protein
MKKLILILAIILGLAGQGWGDDVIVQQTDNETLDGWNTNTPAKGEAFTCAVSGKKITSVSIWVSKEGSPTGTAVAKIYSVTGTVGTNAVPNALLATSDTVNLSTFPTWSTKEARSFAFSGANQITLTNGTDYAVTVEVSGDLGGGCYWMRHDGTIALVHSKVEKSLGTWLVDDPNRAFYFILYGTDSVIAQTGRMFQCF